MQINTPGCNISYDTLRLCGAAPIGLFSIEITASDLGAPDDRLDNPFTMSTPPTGRAVRVVSGTTKIHFDGFSDLPAQRGDSVSSETFTCLGNKWRLEIFRGGYASVGEGMVSVFLDNLSEKKIYIGYSFSVKDCKESQVVEAIFNPAGGGDGNNSWGELNFSKLSKIMNSLVDGALVIEVYMKLVDDSFIPENTSACEIIRDMFMDEEFADIFFEVGGQQSKSHAMKISKMTLSVMFPAHRFILRKHSSTLAELCESAVDRSNPIPICDVSPDVFGHLLFHVYGGEIAADNMKSHAKEIIDAADRFGVIDLKLAAEACLVDATAFSVENLLDLLLYAHSKNCALLKEAAMDFILENKVEVLENVSFNDAPGALVSDVLAEMARGEVNGGTDGNSGTELRAMRISKLRRIARDRGMNVDGSRETMIAALRAALKEDS